MKKESIINFLERFCAIISVLLTLIITYILKFQINNLINYQQLFSNTIMFVSILIGVLMTLMGFLLGFSNEKVVQRIKDNGGDKILIGYFIRPIIAGIVIVIMSLVLETLYEQNISYISTKGYIILSVIWTSLFSLFIALTSRVILLMYAILTKVFDEAKDKEIELNENAEISFDKSEDIY